MQNSTVESHVSEEANHKTRSLINLADGSGCLPGRQPIRGMPNLKESQLKECNSNKNIGNCSIRSQSPTVKSCMTSTTSRGSYCPVVDPKDETPKQKNKFTRPRLNQLTTQRINRLRGTPAVNANADQTRLPRKKKDAKNCSQASMKVESALVENKIDSASTPQPFEVQEKMPSNLMRRGVSFPELGHGYKGETHANDDLIAMPKNLSQSVNDLKLLYHDVLLDGFKFISEQFETMSTEANGEAVSAACREDLCDKLYRVLSDKVQVMDNQLIRVCQSTYKEETAELTRQIYDLTEVNAKLKAAEDKLEMEFADIRQSRDKLQQLLDHLQEKNYELTIELSDKNEQIKDQSVLIDTLRTEVKELKNAAKVVQKQVSESNSTLEDSSKTALKQQERIDVLEALLLQRNNYQSIMEKNVEELTQALDEKKRQLCEQASKLLDLDEIKASLSIATSSEVDTKPIKSVLQKEKERQQKQLEEVKQAEKMLRSMLEEKEEALRNAELKTAHLEEQVEHHRQLLAVRSGHINRLDQEMKQRESEHNRRLNEIMVQTSEKDTLITQISNQLASTNEQFQILYSTISSKQSKLHSQKHAIKLLEENNKRSVLLYTKLSEKNALLTDELKDLRRMINNLMLGNAGSDSEVADNHLE